MFTATFAFLADGVMEPETLLYILGGVLILALVVYAAIRMVAAHEAEQEARSLRIDERRLQAHPQIILPPHGATASTGHVHIRHAHGKTRHRIHRYANGGYCIDDVDMDLGLDLADLVTMGILSMQDVNDYNQTSDGIFGTSPTSLPTIDFETQSPVPEQFFHVTPVETPSSSPDWGDSHSAPEPSHYEAPSSHESYSSPSYESSSSSSYDSGSSSSSSSDSGSSSGGGDW